MGTAGLGLVLGGSLAVGRGCLPWWCRVLCRGACWRAVLRVCPAWPACGARSLPGRAVAQARGHPLSLAGPFGSMAGPVGARLRPIARQWGVCTWGGGVWFLSPRLPALSLCPFSPACSACLPSLYPLGWPFAGRLVSVVCHGVSFLQSGVGWVRFGGGLLVWCAVPRVLKRYPEPMAHGPEACEPSHPCGSCDTGCQRDIPVL